MLPDVDQDSWDAYQNQQTQQAIQDKIDGFGLTQAVNDKIATLQPPVQDDTPPPPPPAPPPQPDLSRIGSWATQPPPTLDLPPPGQDDQSAPETLPPPQSEPFDAQGVPSSSPPAPMQPSMPPPAPPVQPPAPSPAPASQPSSQSSWLADVFGAGLNAVSQAGGDVDAFAQDFGSKIGQAGQQASDIVGGALTAASNAGADIDQFASGFQLPSMPAPAAPAVSAQPTSTAGVPDWLSTLIAQNAPPQLASDPDFIRTVAAGAKAESGWDTNRVQNGYQMGSGQGARGLFQFDMGGMGAGVPEQALLGDQGAAYQASKIVPLYAQAYQNAPAGLTGAEKASWVAAQAEKPLGYDNPNSAARRNYAAAYGDVSGQGAQAGASTQELLGRIGSWASPGGTGAMAQSQFGDPQLTADEAYAACGPAAAVRFAQMYGRNPTLREATDLAATVGWTPGQGMAGLSSEKALMDKMGVATHVVGPDIGAMAAEAQTGNPVTISTPGHYFFADGYDPNSGAFHVGQSGLDLRGGGEWMTPAQMQARMGAIQGALFADNPVAPAPSTADMTSNPSGFLDRARSTIGSFLGGLTTQAQQATSSLEPAVRDLDAAVQNVVVGTPSTITPGGSQPMPSDALTNPLGTGNLPHAAPEPVVDEAIANALSSPQAQAVGGVLQDFGMNGPIGAFSQGLRNVGSAVNSLDPNSVLDAIDQARQQLGQDIANKPLEPSDLYLGLGLDPNNPATQALSTVAKLGASAIGGFIGQPSALDAINTMTDLTNKYPMAGSNGLLPDLNAMTPEDRARYVQSMFVIGATTPSATWDPRTSADPANRAVGRMFDPANQVAPPSDQGSLLDRIVRATTNRYEAADRYQEQALRDAGYTDLSNPPQNLDVSAQIREQNGDAHAESLIDQYLKPAVQDVRDQQDALKAYLTHSNTVDVAQAIGDAVEAQARSKPVPSNLTDDLDAKNAVVKARQNDVTRLSRATTPDPVAIRAAQNRLWGAQRAARNAEARVNAAKAQILVDAKAAGQAARDTRAFSGGIRAPDAQRALQVLQSELGPTEHARVVNAANNIYSFLDSRLQHLVDSGVIDSDTADQWRTNYPHWVPTRILDYQQEGAQSGALRPGAKISLADDGVRQYTREGTDKFAQDPLASIVDYVHSTETRARRNQLANAFVNLDNLRDPAARRLVQTDRPATANEPIVQRINNGKVERYLAPRELAAAINGPTIQHAPGFTRAWTNLIRNTTTVLNPAFALVRNPTMDIPEFTTRTLGREGGNPFAGGLNPRNWVMTRMASALARGYGDAMQGLLQGEYRGPLTREYFEGGGGGSTLNASTVASRAQKVRGMLAPQIDTSSPAAFARSVGQVGAHLVNNKRDMLEVAKQIATMRPVAALAERTELGPRLAEMQLAKERTGARPVTTQNWGPAGPVTVTRQVQRPLTRARAVLQGRTVTMDFNEGGTLAKTINSFIPFFNVGVQGSAQVARAFRENPSGMMGSVGLTVGAPAMMAEAWNNADPQRARDYADVPQYLKDQGIVIMAPWGASVDAQGNRHPDYWWINSRGYAPFSTAARTAAHQALESTVGTPTPTDWGDALKSMIWGESPIRATNLGDVPGSLTPEFLPGLGTATQLAQNRDYFRNRDIATRRNDEQAAQLAREIAGGMTAVGRTVDPSINVHPSQVDFAIRDMFGGVGSEILGARQMLPGAQSNPNQTPLQTAPVVGGIAQALGIRNAGGEIGAQARAHTISPDSQRFLQSEGVEWTPSPVEAQIGKLPLTTDEEARYQQLANQYVEQRLQEIRAGNELEGMPADAKVKYIQDQISRARKEASSDVLDSIPDDEYNRRLDAALAALQAGG